MQILSKLLLTYFSLVIFVGIVYSCESGSDDDFGTGTGTGIRSGNGTIVDNTSWSIPTSLVFDGGPGKDGIPALINPPMISAGQADYLNNNDLVIGYKVGDDIRAYPHQILDWHEIINDNIGGQPLAITYCPLTGTGIGWDRMIEGNVTTFGVSGLLFNTNLIPYDRSTNSNWSQMKLESVNGRLIGETIPTFQVVETTWETWKNMYPNSMVVSNNTGISRPYGLFPYLNANGDYRNQPFLLFPIEVDDNRLPRKDRVHGIIIDGKAKVYRVESFENGIASFQDTFEGEELIVVGSDKLNFANSFYRALGDGTLLELSSIQNVLPAVLEDSEGNRWDIFGEAIAGPRTGQKLIPTTSFIGYWFSWGAFYPNAEIFNP
jgi:hypothetical protein